MGPTRIATLAAGMACRLVNRFAGSCCRALC